MDDSDFESHISEERQAITRRQEQNKTSFGAIKPYMTSAANTAVDVLNPIHTNEQGQIEWGPTLVHGLTELPLLTGAAAGAGKRIYNALAGVDPTIAAQNAASERAAQMKLQAAQARQQQRATASAAQTAVKQQQATAGSPMVVQANSGAPVNLQPPATPSAQPTFTPEGNLPPLTREQAAAHVANLPEHPNPITSIEPSVLSQVGASSLAADTKEAIAQQKKIKGKAGAAVEPVNAERFVPPISSNPVETALTPKQQSARGWLQGQWGGPQNYFKGVQDIFGGVPPSYTAEEGQHAIGKDAHQTILDWRKANIEGPKVNLTKDMKKAFKGGAGLAVLTAIPGFAEAAQNKDLGKMTDIFTDFFVLPFAQSRGVNEGEEQELAKRRYEGAVGGGRGISPPSAYQQ